jgi:hypothetical protein
MFVVGRVLDPQGKSVPNASLMVHARTAVLRLGDSVGRSYLTELGRGSSDSTGRFRINVPRTSSSRHDEFGAVALAPGYGAGWAELDTDADLPTADITLRPEQPIQGRLFDLQGRPADHVKVSVTAIRRVIPAAPNERRDTFEGPAFWWTHPDELAGWPSPAISDAAGRFVLHGVGPGLRVFLTVIDPHYSNQVIEIDTDAVKATKSLSVVLQPARIMTGRVTYADAGKPVSNARVQVAGFDQFVPGVGARPIIATTDDAGKFRAHPGPGTDGLLSAFAPDGQPYLVASQVIDWPKGAVAHSADLALPRGMSVRGQVTERDSGRTVAGALVEFFHGRTAADGVGLRQSVPTETSADGTFALVVPARRGHLLVRAATDDYVLQAVDRGLLFYGQPGGRREYVHAFMAYEPKPNGESQNAQNLNVVIRRSTPLKGRVVGPDGQPVSGAWLFARVCLDPRTPGPFRSWSADQHPVTRDGRFELRGLDPDADVPVSFLEPKSKLGATVRFSGKSADGEAIVKLESCGAATARLVGPDGKPLAKFTPRFLISMAVTPGEFLARNAQKNGTPLADQATLTAVAPINYLKQCASDAQGRIVFPVLIPGATYRLVDHSPSRTPDGPQLRKEFTVKPGETVDLGDILIAKPAP